jgi:uncharacterized DUF497 family protein
MVAQRSSYTSKKVTGCPAGSVRREKAKQYGNPKGVVVLVRILPAVFTKRSSYLYVDIGQTKAYICNMKYLNWNSEKNEILKSERGISFEEIAYLIESGQILGIEENRGRPNQKMYILEIANYAVIVPFVEKDNEIFLKTAFPSSKYTKRYGLKGES